MFATVTRRRHCVKGAKLFLPYVDYLLTRGQKCFKLFANGDDNIIKGHEMFCKYCGKDSVEKFHRECFRKQCDPHNKSPFPERFCVSCGTILSRLRRLAATAAVNSPKRADDVQGEVDSSNAISAEICTREGEMSVIGRTGS